MGNQPSSGEGGGAGGSGNKVRGFMGTRGLLGLSKAELDERCRPSGLYPSCQWEDKAIRKLIGDGKLAARLRGTENRTSPTDRECPICFLQYTQVNTTKCCSAFLCTECYLQVRPQKPNKSSSNGSATCPFCNHNKFSVTVAQAMNPEAMLLREETEQRVIEAKIRERAQQQQQQQQNSNNGNSNNNINNTPAQSGFGSSLLEQNERLLRARSNSLSEHNPGTPDAGANIPEEILRSSFAMTPEERRMLEDEMRAQHSHPLSLRLEAEAEERRIQNEREFLRNNPTHHLQQHYAQYGGHHHNAASAFMEQQRRHRSARLSSGSRGGLGGLGGAGERRNWNQIVEAFERGGHGEVNSLDDLVVLEAAMILSMEEESRRRGAGNNNNSSASAAAASGGAAASAAAGAGGDPFDASRHANEGFPLVRSILSGRQSGTTTGTGDEQLQSLANTIYNSRRRSGRNSLLSGAGGRAAAAALGGNNNNNLDTAMDTAGLLMRGISEDDQIAMAIAASLQEQQQQDDGDGEEGEGEENNNNNENDNSAEAEAGNQGAATESGGATESSSGGEASANAAEEAQQASTGDSAEGTAEEATNNVVAPEEATTGETTEAAAPAAAESEGAEAPSTEQDGSTEQASAADAADNGANGTTPADSLDSENHGGDS